MSFGGGFGSPAPSLVSAEKSDVRTVVKAHLQRLKADASSAAVLYTDTMSKIHLQDISDRISKALDPK
jgi:ribosomal protein S20